MMNTVSGGWKCTVKIDTGDWETSGLYYVATEQLARMSLVIIHKIEMYMMHLWIWLKKSLDRTLKVSVDCFLPKYNKVLLEREKS